MVVALERVKHSEARDTQVLDLAYSSQVLGNCNLLGVHVHV